MIRYDARQAYSNLARQKRWQLHVVELGGLHKLLI